MNNISKLASLCVWVLGSFGASFGAMSAANAIEKPHYDVIASAEVGGVDVEMRQYAPYIVAETVVEAESLKVASSEGFKRLAGFIFGGNRTRESMDMTAPVQTEKMSQQIKMTAPVETVGGPGRYTIGFVMPAKYTLDTLPLPNDARISIRQVAQRKVAAIVFSGFWSTSNFDEHTALLKSYLANQGIEETSEPMIARYNMPLTPWFLRRNEVLISVK